MVAVSMSPAIHTPLHGFDASPDATPKKIPLIPAFVRSAKQVSKDAGDIKRNMVPSYLLFHPLYVKERPRPFQ